MNKQIWGLTTEMGHVKKEPMESPEVQVQL